MSLSKEIVMNTDNLVVAVMRGEKWALSGENGAGKSTLLSLVCADYPHKPNSII